MNINLKTKLFISDPSANCGFFADDSWRRGATCMYDYSNYTKADIDSDKIKQIKFTLFQEGMKEPLWFEAIDGETEAGEKLLDPHFVATDSGIHFHLNPAESMCLCPTEDLGSLLHLQITVVKPADDKTGADDITTIEDEATFFVLDSFI